MGRRFDSLSLTGIPNIEFYTAIKPGAVRILKMQRTFEFLLAAPIVKRALKALVGARVKGPTARQRESLRSLIWGEAVDADGRTIERRLECPEGYQLTVDSALKCVDGVLSGKVVPGAKTPSLAFGPEFVLGLDNVKLLE